MKKALKLMKFISALLIVTGSFFSCGDEWEDIPVENKICECDHDRQPLNRPLMEVNNILLLDTEKISYEEIGKLINKNDGIYQYAICDFTVKHASFIKIQGNWYSFSDICNFPFDVIHDIPAKGIYISFKANVYEKCKPVGGIPEYSYADIILTSLKTQTK